ncbi:septum formation initiator [Actinomadura viridis]|uniref:Pilus assembly protein CpaE n=1 Tax=Actinomadura viridis TaxID=58110 RepID=A0A931GHB5_9ACTN|nr:TadE/TadG family type IV pilus assembly protein [Actinomadura viridis]MBG6087215.1 pilus assembly protein CpaE [Actinomadura viridis]
MRRPPAPAASARRDSGAVEFTGILPVLLTTCLLVWEAFLVGMSATYTGHAANEGARVAAVGGDHDEVKKAAVQRIAGLWADEENIQVRYPTGDVCDPRKVPRVDEDCGYVRVNIKVPLLFPGVLLPMTVSARTKVVYEQEGAR